MSDDIQVKPTTTWRERRQFQHLPWSIYQGDPHWVPPLLADERQMLGWGRHPYYEQADSITLLARRGGKAVGRMMVQVNPAHNRKYGDKLGFFGFFESIDDSAVARALFEVGGLWLRERGMEAVRGPVNPSLNYTCGLLVDGFDRSPCFLMTHNPPYYAGLLESCGLAKSQDLYAYEMNSALLADIMERYQPAVLSALESGNLVVRPFDPARYQQEIDLYLDVYNRSLEGTWGFTPLAPAEARQIGRELRHVLDPHFAAFAQLDGQVVGAVLALPDYNQIIRKLNGRLFPFGFLRLLTGRRHITAARVMAVTMVPGFQHAGLALVLLDYVAHATIKRGITRYEFSWVLESNKRSRGTLERAGMKIVSTYRLYDKAL